MTRADLIKLVEEVPDARVESIAVVLRRVIDDPEAERLMGIPWDDEPYTDEERAEDAEGRAAIARGEGIDWTELKKQLDADDD